MRQSRAFFCSVVLAICFLGGFSLSPSYGGETISLGMTLPQFALEVPDPAPVEQYLGLKNTGSLLISQIPAKLILIQFFSLYCPHCHRQAPITNKVFKIIREDQTLDRDCKMIGIGVGNGSRETDAYKNKFRVQFPLFPDQTYEVHKKLGEPRTPFILVVSNTGKVLLTQEGIIKDVDEFLHQVRNLHKQQ